MIGWLRKRDGVGVLLGRHGPPEWCDGGDPRRGSRGAEVRAAALPWPLAASHQREVGERPGIKGT